MDDFMFRGRHISEFGAVAAFGESMRIGGKVSRGEYELPGGGSTLIGEDVWKPTSRSVQIVPADGVDADADWRREILGWLQGGRGEMYVDNDPEVILIAQFDTDGTFDYKSWPGGCLTFTMTLQPLAYAALETQRTLQIASGAPTVMALDLGGALRTPISVCIRCTSGVITDAVIEADGVVLALSGMQLEAGSTVEYDGGTFLGDPVRLKVNGEIDFRPAQDGRWAWLTLTPGEDVIRVTVNGGDASVTVSGRGRWPG